ncbi:hypothetical protein NCAS_0B06950 [Naumovozyma castellii]|uniref:Protein kinase domain-containing protein n=1 Tax=Naumovozyma castellii TaxID=27288 RepID=G0VA49_NAUCA|nr:hypothetical protein NCAS_0B06950 [Naumovozyma castellii CBS 4309]CCC68779.1 hypothetical protein NCAS_0B06950 [Naumovozyma castellii CBS 4309]
MNFTSIFKSISNFQFPYTLEETPNHETGLWQVFNGTRKSDSLPITAFKAKPNSTNAPLISNAIHKSKVLKIPGLCKVLETFDSDANATFIVVERVSPFPWVELSKFSKNKFALGLVVSQILTTLKFLDAFVLGTLSEQSIYLTDKGECVLFGLELCTKKTDVDPYAFANNLRVYAACMGIPMGPEDSKLIDPIKLVQLINRILGTIPKDWKIPASALEKGNMTIDKFVDKIHNTQTWIGNPLIAIHREFTEFHIKDPEGKLVVITDVENIFLDSRDLLRNLLPGFLENLIIPELCNMINLLINSQMNPNAASLSKVAATKLISFIAILLDLSFENQYFNEQYKQVVFASFKLQDRQIRFLLLIYLPKLIDTLDSNDVSSKIYPHFIQGLTDSDATLRLQTLKSIPIIVPSITERQLNNELLRYLAKTQVDSDIEIRTWTVIILTRVSSKLDESSRSSILATAFTKSLKDPDIKPRLASLYGLSEAISLFDVSTIANKILTVIAPGLLDKDPLVRMKAKDLFERYLNKLESQAMLLQEANMEIDKSKDIDFDSYGTDDTQLVEQFMNNLKITSVNTNISLKEEEESKENFGELPSHMEANPFNGNLDVGNTVVNGDDDGWADFDIDDGNLANNETSSSQFFNQPVNMVKSWNDELNEPEQPKKYVSPLHHKKNVVIPTTKKASLRNGGIASKHSGHPIVNKKETKNDDIDDGWDNNDADPWDEEW